MAVARRSDGCSFPISLRAINDEYVSAARVACCFLSGIGIS